MVIQRISILILILIISTIGCTKKTNPRNKHEGQAETLKDDPIRFGQKNIEALKKTYDNRHQVDKIIHSKESNFDQLHKILKDLSPYVLNVEYIEDANVNTGKEMVNAIDQFMRAMHRILVDYPIKGPNIDEFKRLDKAMYADCQTGLKECQYIRIYAQAPMTATIVAYKAKSMYSILDAYEKLSLHVSEEIVKKRSNCTVNLPDGQSLKGDCIKVKKSLDQAHNKAVDQYFFYLQAGFETKNWQQNLDFDIMFVRYSDHLFRRMKSLPPNLKNKARYRQLHYLYNTSLGLIRRYGEGTEGQDEFCKKVIQAKPFATSWSNLSEKKRLNAFTEEFIRCASKKKILQKTISDYQKTLSVKHRADWEVENSELGFYAGMDLKDMSYSYAISSLRSSKFMMNGLGIKNMGLNGAEAFLLDQIYYEKIDLKTATAYWEHIKDNVDSKKFLETIDNYLKVHVAYNLKSTYLSFNKIFKEEYAKSDSLRTEMYCKLADRVHEKTHPEWYLLDVRLELLKTFVSQIYNTKFRSVTTGASRELVDSYKNIIQKINQLKQTLNYVATAPLMLAMKYYMSKSEGKITCKVLWWPKVNNSYSFEGKTELANIFSSDSIGGAKRMFNFGEQQFEFNVVQKFYAYDFALRSGLFEFIPFDIYDDSANDSIFSYDQKFHDIAKSNNVKDLSNQKYPIDGTIQFKDKENILKTNQIKISDSNELLSLLSLNNEHLFLKNYVDDLIRISRKEYNKAMKSIDNIRLDRDFVERFEDICRDPFNANLSINLSAFANGILTSEVSIYAKLTHMYVPSEFVSIIRKNVDILRILIEVTDTHIKSGKQSGKLSKIKSQFGESISNNLDLLLEEYGQMERNYFTALFELDRMVVNAKRDCLIRLQYADQFQKNSILRENISFYKDVHAAAYLLNLVENSIEIAERRVIKEVEIGALVNSWYKSGVFEPRTLEGESLAATVVLKMKDDIRNRMSKIVYDLYSFGLIDFLRRESSEEDIISEGINYLLGIHNILGPPFSIGRGSSIQRKSGFFVHGPSPVDYKTFVNNRSFKRLNRISANGIDQGVWDSVARVRSQINELDVPVEEAEKFVGMSLVEDFEDVKKQARIFIGDDLRIIVPSLGQLEAHTNDIYKDNTTKLVTFEPNQNSFVRKSLRTLFSSDYVGWFNGDASKLVDPLRHRINWLLRIQSYHAIELKKTDKEFCPTDEWGDIVATRSMTGELLAKFQNRSDVERQKLLKCHAFKVQPKDIIEYFVKLGKILRMTPEDQELLYMIMRDDKDARNILTYFDYQDHTETANWTWFDKFYRKNLTTVGTDGLFGNGSTKLSTETFDGKYAFPKLEDTYLKRIRPLAPIFKFSSDIEQYARNNIRKRMLRHLKRIELAEENIMDLEDSNNDESRLGKIIYEKTTTDQTDKDHEVEVYKGEKWRVMRVLCRDSSYGTDRVNTPIYHADKGAENFKNWFRNTIADFFRDGRKGCKALPRRGDPDFDDHENVYLEMNKLKNCEVFQKKYFEIIDQNRQEDRKERRKISGLNFDINERYCR